MFRLDGGRPGDAREFLHKSFIGRAIGGVAKRVITSTPIGGAVATGLGIARTIGFRRAAARPVASRTATARPSLRGAQGKELGRDLKFGGGGGGGRVTNFPIGRGVRGVGARSVTIPLPDVIPCIWPAVRDEVTGECILGERPGRDLPSDRPVGEAVMGQFGAALVPGSMPVDRAVCPRGMLVATDGLCYNKGSISNKHRMWPAGRRPLLTGGDMRAIAIAARAGAKLEGTTKRLRGLGMMKALPKPRATKAHAHAKPVAAVSV